ncbi:hypothetical protein OUZ56_019925 [Daphnia magna]|uniref:Uncharacterized protein n=1 Tax=Daphnia magna TaxID=35525 RepID=A0ABQ9ZD10_9CRUS|nr:hypothetical protein OUZ56_019925 [Daphnia magna]
MRSPFIKLSAVSAAACLVLVIGCSDQRRNAAPLQKPCEWAADANVGGVKLVQTRMPVLGVADGGQKIVSSTARLVLAAQLMVIGRDGDDGAAIAGGESMADCRHKIEMIRG